RLDHKPRLRDDRPDRDRPAGTARVGDDAKRAAMVAALLDLEIGAGAGFRLQAPTPSLPRLRGREDWSGGSGGAVALHLKLSLVVQHHIRERRVFLRRQGRRASGDNDLPPGKLPPRPADCLASLALSFGGDGAGIDDHRVGEPGLPGRTPDRLALEGIEAAAEGDDLDRPHHQPPSKAASNEPSKLVAAGPVITTCPSSRHAISSR